MARSGRSARQAPQKQAESSKPAKTYGDQNLYAIWWALFQYATPENPLTVEQIHKILTDAARDAEAGAFPGVNEEELSSWEARMELLFPGFHSEAAGASAAQPAGAPPLHIQIETPDGEVLKRDGMLLEATPASFQAPCEKTIINLLQSLEQDGNTFPYSVCALANIARRGEPPQFVPYNNFLYDPARDLKRSGFAPSDSDGPRNNIKRYYYLKNCLTDAEWRIFTDLVLTYPFITESQAKKFLTVLDQLHKPPENARPTTRYAFRRGGGTLFQHLAVLDEAVRDNRMVTVMYGKYKLDLNSETGKWEPRLTRKGEEGTLELLFEPYALIWSNGNYYLIGKNRDIMHLRADRILAVTPREEHFTLPNEFVNLKGYRDQNPVMYPARRDKPNSNGYAMVRLQCHTRLLSVLIDFFGNIVPAYSAPNPDGTVTVSMTVAPAGVKLFALQYAGSVKVLSPEKLRREIMDELRAAADKYDKP